MNYEELEHESPTNMKKIINKHFKTLKTVDDYVNFICELRARAWYWQEEDHMDMALAKFYHRTWQGLFGKVAQELTPSEYMDFYYNVDPNP